MSLERLQVYSKPVFSATETTNQSSFTDNIRTAGNSVKDEVVYNTELSKKPHYADRLLPDDPFSRLKAGVKQTSKLPKYAVEGLQGNQNANFFEFNKLAAIPYWMGGPILALIFMAGGDGAKKIWKQKAAGVAAYYALAIAAKAVVDTPVKIFKGIDLNQKYEKVVHLKPDEKNRNPQPKTELHNVLESKDFLRSDLLYKEDISVAKNPALVNQEYKEMAKDIGYKKDLQDSDSAVLPYIRQIIATSRAWKSALIIPFAAVAAGISAYDGWGTIADSFKDNWRDNVKLPKTFMGKAKGVGTMVKLHLLDHVGGSFKEFWGPAKKVTWGKVAIIASAAAIVAANINLLRITKPEKEPKLKIDESKYSRLPVNRTTQLAATKVDKSNQGINDYKNKLEPIQLYDPKKNEYIL